MAGLSCWFKMLFINCFEMAQMQVFVHHLHTLGALMVTVSYQRGVMETLTALMAVMKWAVQVSCVHIALPCSIDMNIGGTHFTRQLHVTAKLRDCR